MAYSNLFDITLPLGSELRSTTDDYLRAIKGGVTERLDDIFGTSGGTSFKTADPYRPFLIKLSGSVTSKILPGATSLSLRNNADNADNILINDNGTITFRNALTVTVGNLTLSSGNLSVPNGNLSVGTTIAAGTSLSVGTSLTVGSFATITGLLTASVGLVVSANGIIVTGNSSITGNLAVTGSVTGTFVLNNSSASGTFDFTGNVRNQEYNAGNAGSAITLNLNNGNNQKINLNSDVDCVITYSNARAGSEYQIRVVNTIGGVYTHILTLPISGGIVSSFINTNVNTTIFSGTSLDCTSNSLQSAEILIFKIFYDGTRFVITSTVKYT